MIKKSYSKTGRFCRVTFELSKEVNAQTAFLCGEFNNWRQGVPTDSSMFLTARAGKTTGPQMGTWAMGSVQKIRS